MLLALVTAVLTSTLRIAFGMHFLSDVLVSWLLTGFIFLASGIALAQIANRSRHACTRTLAGMTFRRGKKRLTTFVSALLLSVDNIAAERGTDARDRAIDVRVETERPCGYVRGHCATMSAIALTRECGV